MGVPKIDGAKGLRSAMNLEHTIHRVRAGDRLPPTDIDQLEETRDYLKEFLKQKGNAKRTKRGNPIALDLRTDKYKQRVVEDKNKYKRPGNDVDWEQEYDDDEWLD